MGAREGPDLRGASLTLQRRWWAIFSDALDEARELLRITGYGTPDAYTWTMEMAGDCGVLSRRFGATSHDSPEHARWQIEQQWACWVADTLAPGRNPDWTDWLLAEPPALPALPVKPPRVSDKLPKLRRVR